MWDFRESRKEMAEEKREFVSPPSEEEEPWWDCAWVRIEASSSILVGLGWFEGKRKRKRRGCKKEEEDGL